MNFIVSIFSISLFLGCGGHRQLPGAATTNPEEVLPSGLRYIQVSPGTGEEAHEGMMVSVHYTGYLMDGTKFDSSMDRDEPLEFVLGSGRVIRGWEEGIAGMKTGEKRKLIIPSQLGYGERGWPGLIPANADLVFDVHLVSSRMLDQTE
jgi:FKBP-type peptidyl-prolyl cis-trans isomerase